MPTTMSSQNLLFNTSRADVTYKGSTAEVKLKWKNIHGKKRDFLSTSEWENECALEKSDSAEDP